MTVIASSLVAVIAQDYPYAFGGGFVSDQQADGRVLSAYFNEPVDGDWRIGFQEPTLEQTTGLGLPLLPFDF